MDLQCVMFLFLFLLKELFLVASCSGDLRKECIFSAERVAQVMQSASERGWKCVLLTRVSGWGGHGLSIITGSEEMYFLWYFLSSIKV